MTQPIIKPDLCRIIIEDAKDSDFPYIHAIYESYVLYSTVTMEEIPPNLEDMKKRWRESVAKKLPFIVAKIDGAVAGYAYAFPYRSRSGYRFSVEESIYLAEAYQGLGIGKKLLSTLINTCRNNGFQQMIAVIAGTDNHGSIKLHESLGFFQAGVLQHVGFKLGKHVDTIIMQKEL